MVRIQSGVITVVLILALLFALGTGRIPAPGRRALAGTAVIAVACCGFFAAHGLVLSGYPAFPAPVLGAPVSWAVPSERAALEIEIIQAWAKGSGEPGAQVPGFSWAPRWAQVQSQSAALVSVTVLAAAAMLLLLLVSVLISFRQRQRQGRGLPGLPRIRAVLGAIGLVAGSALIAAGFSQRRDHSLALFLGVGICTAVVVIAIAIGAGRRDSSSPDLDALAAVGLASLAFVVAWAVSAPTPRFALGALWLLAAAPATVAVLALRKWAGKIVAGVAMAALVVTSSSFQISRLGALGTTPVVADGPGWLGFWPPREVPTSQVTVPDGTQVRAPTASDQCGDAPLPCTPFADGSWRYVDPAHIERGFVGLTVK